MNYVPITAVGIDVSKNKSWVAIRRPGGEVLVEPFMINHDVEGINELISIIKKIDGDVKIVMEHTGMYWRQIATSLKVCGFHVCVVNAMLIHDFSDNSLRKVKTDRADALKIANYALSYWMDLPEYSIEDDNRILLKMQCRMYERMQKTSTILRNELIALLDQTFPNINRIFDSQTIVSSGHLKWVDFVKRFWHKETVTSTSFSSFADTFQKWCKRNGYQFSYAKAEEIFHLAKNSVATFPKNDSTKILITQSANSLTVILENLKTIRDEMYNLASKLPEFNIVMSMHGVGKITGPSLIAEIGDVRKFKSKNALVDFAGMDAPPYQSGMFESSSRHVSKRGSPHLRRTLFQTASMILVSCNFEDPVFCFMDRKRNEGKHFYVYTVAGCAKFLRIYYAKVKEYLSQEEIKLVNT